MANLDNPHGLIPLRRLGGGPLPSCTRYRKEASVILGIGDPVVHAGGASTAGTNGALENGIPTVTRAAAASGTITGVAMFFEIDAGVAGRAHQTLHMAAADKGYVYVMDDPMVVFGIQEDSDGNSLVMADVGEGVDITIGNADTNTGLSICEIDSSTSAAQIGNADQLRLMALVNAPDNEFAANAEWEVMINEHTYAGVGTMI